MKDQVDSLRVLDLPAVSIHSLMSLGEQEEALGRISAGAYKIIYASPERLRNSSFLSAIQKCSPSLVAVDEAHCISEWGHDFRPDYLRIRQALEWLGRPQTIALTATATGRVREDIIQQLELRSPRQFVTGFDRENLYFEVVPVQNAEEKISLLASRLEDLQGGAIIYTGTRKGVEALVGHLTRLGLKAVGYHAGMDEEERNRIQDLFLQGEANLIAATNAFAWALTARTSAWSSTINFPERWKPIIRSAAAPAGTGSLLPASSSFLPPTAGFRSFSSSPATRSGRSSWGCTRLSWIGPKIPSG